MSSEYKELKEIYDPVPVDSLDGSHLVKHQIIYKSGLIPETHNILISENMEQPGQSTTATIYQQEYHPESQNQPTASSSSAASSRPMRAAKARCIEKNSDVIEYLNGSSQYQDNLDQLQQMQRLRRASEQVNQINNQQKQNSGTDIWKSREEIQQQQQQQQQPSGDQIANNQRVAAQQSSARMLPSPTGGVWQLGYNMRNRQGNTITTRNQAAAAANAASPTELQATQMQTTVSQQNAQNMQQLSPRATVYPMPNYTQQDLQNARHHMNAAVNIPQQTRQMSYNPMYTRYATQPVPAFPVHPDVVFKRLPFFDHLGDLIKPSSLLPSNTPQRLQEQQFTFHLTPGQATEIATNRDVRPNAKLDYVYQVQLRFCLLETSCEQEDFFPPGVTVKVNNKICPLPNPIPTNKQGVEPKRPPKPVNITPLVKLSPTVMNHVQIGWAADYNKGYVIRISMVRKLSAGQLLTRLKSKGVKHADHTTGLIKEKLNEDADCEIATTSLRVSLLCPLGKFRMNVPCRATTCNHLQCFDASVYLEMNERRATWTCPVCDKPALYDNLVIDGYFQDVLNSPKLPHSECDIELHKDGSWQVHVAKKETPVNTTSVNESVEILGDDIEVIPIASSTTPNPKPASGGGTIESKEEPKKPAPVVDLTLSDSDDEDDLPLKRKTPSGTTAANSQQRPDSTKRRMIENNGSVSSTSSTNSNNTRYGTPGPSNVTSSGYQSPSVITVLDSPSPPPRD